MKIRILLFLMITGALVNAQVVCDYPEAVNRSLIISEANIITTRDAYIEITNMGDKPVLLSDYKFGRLIYTHSSVGAVRDLCNDPWYTTSHSYMFLPNRTLNPGESFVLTNAYDYGPVHYKKGMGKEGGSERPKRIGIYDVADKLIHMAEPVLEVTYPEDSITTAFNDPEQLTRRGDYARLFTFPIGGTYFLEHHYAPGDSAIIDQVGGVFDSNGKNFNSPYDIAGVAGGVNSSILVRKAMYKLGNIDFASGRGVALEDSEWIPIPAVDAFESYDVWRDVFWTIGNHGNYVLDQNTLESNNDQVIVDFAAGKISIPWGILRLDEIMRNMKKKPGVAWRYDLNELQEDSLYRSARTGDKLVIFVVGNSFQSKTFEIEVSEPTVDDNIVIPIDRPRVYDPGVVGPITQNSQRGILSWPRVTRHENGIDTITGSSFGLAFDIRTDSLLKYLEKPINADWEFVWVDGIKRADLKNGDKLKITSESGKVKEYFIQIQEYYPNTNADLASITWPDIPEFYRGIFGWKGDTIPNFSSANTIYQIEVPLDIDNVPSLVAKTSHVNARVKVERAKSLTGKLADRTITFNVTAENDTVHKSYQVEFTKEKFPNKIEPFRSEPFISEYAYRYDLRNNFLEIYNPGNQPIDLRDYMISQIYKSNINSYWALSNNTSWSKRYINYVPGLKYVDNATWSISPRYLLPDPTVNSVIPGGGTFVMAVIRYGDANVPGIEALFPKWDVQFMNHELPGYGNPWNEAVSSGSQAIVIDDQNGMVLFKILNDSIKRGLKPVSDPNDFEIVDIWTTADGSVPWSVAGYTIPYNTTFIRKPHITTGNPERGASFGTNPEDSEWIVIRADIDYSYLSLPERHGVPLTSLNQHYMIEPSYYKSTINSSVYKVSDGFGPDEHILGLKNGVTVAEFLANINKEDDNQILKVVSSLDGSELDMGATLKMNDKLEVTSADGQNSTTYRIDVTEVGLSNNAYLTSNRWDIQVTSDPKSGVADSGKEGTGTISGFAYGTTLRTIVENVNAPEGAKLTIIDGNGAYVSYTTLNFDTAYVSVTVNPDIYLDVVAEDNTTRMLYQLQPNTSESDAFILSDIYEVSQMDNLIHFVPRGTNFSAFLNNIIPSLGASLKLLDKMGFEREHGNIREDDKVVVTSANGEVTRVYFISFLQTSQFLHTTYLAYVLSEAYNVDQVDYKISEGLAPLTGQTLLDEFMSYIIPCLGASVSVIDKDGNVKVTGDLDDGDILKVISADGKIEVIYTLDLDLTSTDQISIGSSISIYPNPAGEQLQIAGIDAGNMIRIFSSTGSLILSKQASSNFETVPLKDVPLGIFMIVISDNDMPIARFKAIKK